MILLVCQLFASLSQPCSTFEALEMIYDSWCRQESGEPKDGRLEVKSLGRPAENRIESFNIYVIGYRWLSVDFNQTRIANSSRFKCCFHVFAISMRLVCYQWERRMRQNHKTLLLPLIATFRCKRYQVLRTNLWPQNMPSTFLFIGW